MVHQDHGHAHVNASFHCKGAERVPHAVWRIVEGGGAAHLLDVARLCRRGCEDIGRAEGAGRFPNFFHFLQHKPGQRQLERLGLATFG